MTVLMPLVYSAVGAHMDHAQTLQSSQAFQQAHCLRLLLFLALIMMNKPSAFTQP